MDASLETLVIAGYVFACSLSIFRPGLPVGAWVGSSHEWSAQTGRAAAHNLLAMARLLTDRPIPAPPD